MNKRSVVLNFISVLIFASFLAAGCKKSDNAEDGFTFYYANNDYTALNYESISIPEESMDSALEAVLLHVSEKMPYIHSIINSYSVNKDQLTLDFKAEYVDQEKIREILTRAALVRTLTGIDGIKTVIFTIEGNPLTDDAGTPIGPMTQEQFVINAGKEINAYEQTTITLYFASYDKDKLVKNTRSVVYNTNVAKEKIVADELAKGISGYEEGISTLTPDTKVLSTTITDGICYINMNSAFLSGPQDIPADVYIYSLVNSLIELNGINKVQILIEGETVNSYKEVINISGPLERNLDIVE